MTDKEIQELQKRVYAISYSGFPLDTFFNDIRNVSDPRFNEMAAYSDLKLIVDEIYDLIEKAKKYDEKETPKRPKRKHLYYNCHNGECDKTFIHYCPICNFSSVEKNYANYCPNCGQKLDWSDENE